MSKRRPKSLPNAPGAEEVIRLIESLDPHEQKRLGELLSPDHIPGFVLVPEAIWKQTVVSWMEREDLLKDFFAGLEEGERRLERFRAGPRSRQKKVTKRHEVIAKLLGQGFSSDEEIWKHIRDHYPELLWKGKAQKDGTRHLITAKHMMDWFRRNHPPVPVVRDAGE
jgi:hypothetical protein